jgi:predicted nucleic acid-binding protein
VIAYLDTSALIPLIIEEPGSKRAERVWDTAERVISVRLVYAEARATLAQAARLGRISTSELSDTVAALDDLYGQLALTEVDDVLVRRAGVLAELHALRGSGAVHLAAAERVADDTTVMVSGDRQLLAAAGTLSLALADTSVDG